MSSGSAVTLSEARTSVHSRRAGRPEAAEVIWHWRDTAAAGAAPVSYARERKRGALQAAVGFISGAFFLWNGWVKLALGVLTVATFIIGSALLSPGGLYGLFDRAASRVTLRIGRALMWALMVPVFYAFFLPFGMLFRRGRRDRLKRFVEPDAPTYWEAHEGETAGSDSRTKQF